MKCNKKSPIFQHVLCVSVLNIQKKLVSKIQKKYFAKCLGSTLGKDITLPSGRGLALGKFFFLGFLISPSARSEALGKY
jgi:hypothetical protein